MEKLQMALHTFLCGRAQATQIQKHIESNNRGDQARLLPHQEHRRWGCLLPAHSEALLIQCKGKVQSKLSFLPCYGLVAGHHWCCEDCSYPSSCQALNLRIALLRFGKLQFPTPSPQLHYFHCSSTCHKPICRLTSGLSFLSIKLLTQTSFLSVVVLEVLWP